MAAWEWRKASGGLTFRTDPYPERLFHAYDMNDNAACDPGLGLVATCEPLTPASKRCPRCILIVAR